MPQAALAGGWYLRYKASCDGPRAIFPRVVRAPLNPAEALLDRDSPSDAGLSANSVPQKLTGPHPLELIEVDPDVLPIYPSPPDWTLCS